jgi:tetratricopeptide (TPR) repeat protein
VAQAAAVLGREFSRDVLAGTTGLEEGRLEAALRDLEDAGVVLDHGEGRHSFAHALVRDVAYESLLRRTRRSLHRAAARALEASAEIATGQPEVVAHHLAEAGEPAEAIAWFERAAELAERRHAYAEAVEHRGRALDALGPAEDDAAAAARRVRIEIDLALALRTIDRIDEAFAPLDRAERLAGRFDRADLLSRVHFVRGNLHFGSGRTEECLASHTRALEEARRAGDPEAEARAWGGLGDAGYSVGTMRSARDSFERCVTLARQHGFETIEADNLPMLAICSSYLLDSVRARELGAAAAALARRLNRPRAQLVASNSLAFECTARGELEEAMAMGRSSVELARRIGSRGFEVSARFFLTTVLAAAGRSDEARAVLKDAVIPEGSVLGTYFGIAAQTRQAAFDGDLEGLRRVFERMDLSRWHFGHVWACVDFMEAALDMRAFDEVDRMREALARCPPPEPIPWVDHYGRLCGALANVGRGRRDEETRRALEELRAAAAVREHHRDVARIDRALATW